MLENIKITKLLLLDLDGTVYLDSVLIGDVVDTLAKIRAKGIKISYITNNSSKITSEYVSKLKGLKIFENNDFIYTSLDATIDYLKTNFSDKSVYPLATKKVCKYIAKNGIKISKNADIVLLAFDKEINYKKIQTANELLLSGALYVSTHPDKVCPSIPVPLVDAGSFIEMFKTSTSRTPDVIVGKPYKTISECLLKRFSVKRSEVTMVGDRLTTDISFGINSNFNTVLVLSGETDLDLATTSEIKADLTIKDINELINYL